MAAVNVSLQVIPCVPKIRFILLWTKLLTS